MTVSPASPDDVAGIAALLEEMDGFYGATGSEPLDDRLRQISDAIFSQPPAAYVLLARDAGELAGFATYSFLWPAAGLTRSLYLKELYIASACRRRGVGKLLLRALFEVAGQHGCSRVEWTTDTDNTAAQVFYAELGLPVHSSKIFYRAENTGAWVMSAG
jgi:ribosomal protein S18 acetylase RimI-like enzyme